MNVQRPHMCVLPHLATKAVKIYLELTAVLAAVVLKVMDRAVWTLMNAQTTSAVYMQTASTPWVHTGVPVTVAL